MPTEETFLLPGDFESDEISDSEPKKVGKESSKDKKRSRSPSKDKRISESPKDRKRSGSKSPKRSGSKSPKRSESPAKLNDSEESRPPKKKAKNMKHSKKDKECKRSSFEGKLVGSRVLQTLQDDPNKKRYALSDGWEKEVSIRTSGNQAGKHDSYLLPPGGKKLRSNVELLKYCLSQKVAVDVATVNFEKLPGPLEESEMTSNTRKLKTQIETLIKANFDMDGGELALLKPRKGMKKFTKQNSKAKSDQFIDDDPISVKKKFKKHKKDKENRDSDLEKSSKKPEKSSENEVSKKSFAKKSTSRGGLNVIVNGDNKKPFTTARKSTGGRPASPSPTVDMDKNFKERQLDYLERQFKKLVAKGRKLTESQAEYISKQLKVKAGMVVDWWKWKEGKMN